jgi:hypothetical protein
MFIPLGWEAADTLTPSTATLSPTMLTIFPSTLMAKPAKTAALLPPKRHWNAWSSKERSWFAANV